MKIYLCMSDYRKRQCKSVTVDDSLGNCRELIAHLSYFSYNMRIYEIKSGLKIFCTVHDPSVIEELITRKEGEQYAEVSNRVLGKV